MIRRNPERLAWTVLLLSFAICLALAVSVPLAVRAFLNDSTDPADLTLEVQQGTALLRRPASADFVGVTDRTFDVPPGSLLRVDQSSQAILTVRDPAGATNLAIVQLYANTDLTLEAADSPRFSASPNSHRLALFVSGGRARINVLDDLSRPVAVSVRSPQGEVAFSAGTFVVEVTNQELQVTSREGTATVSAQETEVVIDSLQRARVELGRPPEGGLSNERNLIADGNFGDVSTTAWAIEHDLQETAERPGAVNFRAVNGRRAAQFERVGPSHAETRLTQRIDRDVTEAASLTLHFSVLIDNQDVPICGSLGSECPLMARINYRDTSDTEREWVQGFYSIAVPDLQNVNPRFCVTCTTRNPHRAVPSNTWYTYDSGNLMDALAVGDLKPSRITRVTFYASGHSYRSAITDVELLVQD